MKIEKITGHKPLDNDLKTRKVTIEFEEPVSLQEVWDKLNSSAGRVLCPRCQRMVNSFATHICEGLKPRFYLEDLVDWGKTPGWARYAAQDKDSKEIYCYEYEPQLGASEIWSPSRGKMEFFSDSEALAIDWTEPLKL